MGFWRMNRRVDEPDELEGKNDDNDDDDDGSQKKKKQKIARRNINNLRYAGDTILMAERAFWGKWKRRVKRLA